MDARSERSYERSRREILEPGLWPGITSENGQVSSFVQTAIGGTPEGYSPFSYSGKSEKAKKAAYLSQLWEIRNFHELQSTSRDIVCMISREHFDKVAKHIKMDLSTEQLLYTSVPGLDSFQRFCSHRTLNRLL